LNCPNILNIRLQQNFTRKTQKSPAFLCRNGVKAKQQKKPPWAENHDFPLSEYFFLCIPWSKQKVTKKETLCPAHGLARNFPKKLP
jgi:hypothetical protein